MKKLLVICCFALCMNLNAQDITWSKDIAPIVYKNCTSCHRPGEIGPFSLTSYEEAKSWGSMMRYVTSIKYMPPWKPDAEHTGKYIGEKALTDTQISKIAQWVDAGMPEGNAAEAPILPTFPTGSQVGSPDLVISFKQSHTHKGNGKDEYRYFVIPTGLTQAKNLVALEMRPGNSQIVHHALMWADSTGSAKAKDDATPEYGYSGDGSQGFGLGEQLPGYVPGQRAHIFKNGLAQRVPKNADLVVQMHYAPTSVDDTDSTTFNLFFTDTQIDRYVRSFIMLPYGNILLNGPFTIPANQVKEFHGVVPISSTVSLLGLSPHMHLLGTHWDIYLELPNGQIQSLLKISDWDFNWQGSYFLKRPIKIPAGSKLHAKAGYNNTTANPNNPSNPPKFVTWGEGTKDEMYYLPVLFVPYKNGDENLDMETILSSTDDQNFHFAQTKLYPIYPNPASDQVRIGFILDKTQKVRLTVQDLSGHLLSTIKNETFYPGEHIIDYNSGALSAGSYTITLQSEEGKSHSQVLIIVK
jgi:hypothetical protein